MSDMKKTETDWGLDSNCDGGEVAILDTVVRACWRQWNESREEAVWRTVGRGFQAVGRAWIKAPSEEGIWYMKGRVESHGYPQPRAWRREKWMIMSESWAEVMMWIMWPMRRNSFILSVTEAPGAKRVTLSNFPFKNVRLASVWRIGSRRAIQEAGKTKLGGCWSYSGKSIGDCKVCFGLGYIIWTSDFSIVWMFFLWQQLAAWKFITKKQKLLALYGKLSQDPLMAHERPDRAGTNML